MSTPGENLTKGSIKARAHNDQEQSNTSDHTQKSDLIFRPLFYLSIPHNNVVPKTVKPGTFPGLFLYARMGKRMGKSCMRATRQNKQNPATVEITGFLWSC